MRERLVELAPDLREQPVVRARMGAEREVWFVGDEHVLRFAPHPSSQVRMSVERKLLERLDGALPVRTPVAVAVSADQSCDLCRKAPGESLDWQEWAGLTRGEKERLSAPLGRVAAALHEAVPADEAREIGIPDYLPVDPDELRQALLDRLRTPAQKRLLDAVASAMPALAASALPEVILHNDLSHHNIGFGRHPRVMTGVFDFAGAAVGDPHRDLRYDPSIEFRGDAMLRAYEEERGLAMSRARQRTWHAVSAFENLRWSLDNEDGALQEARWGWVDAVAAWDLSVLTG